MISAAISLLTGRKPLTYVIASLLAIWLVGTLLLWSGYKEGLVSIGKLEGELDTAVSTNVSLVATIGTLMSDNEKLSNILIDMNKEEVAVAVEEATTITVIANEEDTCLDVNIPTTILDSLQLHQGDN